MLRLRDGDSERGSGINKETGTGLGGAQMRRVLRLRDGDSERGSGMQQGTRAVLGGARAKREIEHKALLPQVQAL